MEEGEEEGADLSVLFALPLPNPFAYVFLPHLFVFKFSGLLFCWGEPASEEGWWWLRCCDVVM